KRGVAGRTPARIGAARPQGRGRPPQRAPRGPPPATSKLHPNGQQRPPPSGLQPARHNASRRKLPNKRLSLYTLGYIGRTPAEGGQMVEQAAVASLGWP